MQVAHAAQDPEPLALARQLTAALNESEAGRQALDKYNIQFHGGQVGVIGEHALKAA